MAGSGNRKEWAKHPRIEDLKGELIRSCPSQTIKRVKKTKGGKKNQLLITKQEWKKKAFAQDS